MSVMRRTHANRLLAIALLSIGAALGSVLCGAASGASQTALPASKAAPPRIIPVPVSLSTTSGAAFVLAPSSRIVVAVNAGKALPVARYLAAILRRSTGYALPISLGNPKSSRHNISFSLSLADPQKLGQEGYRLLASKTSVSLRARTAEGLFRGVQTLRQLLPPQVESNSRKPGPWTVPAVRILDYPRFSWRGAHLDVVRHFFGVADVKRYIDLLSLYKINVLHLHLSDDQGWRIQINSWPKLATVGGSSDYDNGPGGYYTKSDYSAIVRYAASRYMTVVPEIDVPAHSSAAIRAYPELRCPDGGWDTVCPGSDVSYQFLDDVVREISALTPGPYFDVGGDEAYCLPVGQYAAFIKRAEQIVQAHGKKLIGWVPGVEDGVVSPTSVGQLWTWPIWVPDCAAQPWTWHEDDESIRTAVGNGMKIIMSPMNKAFLEEKYNPKTPFGDTVGGYVDVRDSYNWDPATYTDFIGEKNVLGVEAPLWTERIWTIKDIEYMAFPRLPGIAEIGWSPASSHSWNRYKQRLAAQAPRWRVMHINFYRSPQVPWK